MRARYEIMRAEAEIKTLPSVFCLKLCLVMNITINSIDLNLRNSRRFLHIDKIENVESVLTE